MVVRFAKGEANLRGKFLTFKMQSLLLLSFCPTIIIDFPFLTVTCCCQYHFIIRSCLFFFSLSLIFFSFIIQQLLENETNIVSLNNKESQLQKVHVGVYYEALCPDSRSFIVKQLLPTYEKISENLKVDLIPYGKATVSIFAIIYIVKPY